MCSLFSSIDPKEYAFHTRSVRLAGHATSIRLEGMFWRLLEEISALQGVTLGRFLSKLHDETLHEHSEPHSFASLLRCACLTYALEARTEVGTRDLMAHAAQAFGPVPQSKAS